MNIVILSETLWPEGSGGELATYLYARLLAERGVNVKIVVTSNSHISKDFQGGLQTHALPAAGYGKYIIIPLALRELGELAEWSDLIYCTELFSLIPFIKRKFEKPVVVHIHSYFPACPVGSLYNLKENSVCEPNNKDCSRCIWYYERSHLRPIKRTLASTLLNSVVGKRFLSFLKFADALIFVSKAQRNLFLKHAMNLPALSYIVYNPLPELPRMPIEDDNLGYFGGLSPLKGFYVLLKAWLKVYRKHRARIYATKMGNLVNLELLKKVGIASYGRLGENSYENAYRGIRAVIFPSIWQEPSPYVVVESLLRGRLLVTSRVGGIPEIVEGLKGIFMIKPNDVDGLADALDQALSMDGSEAAELGLKNREGILKRFDNCKSVNELIKVFEKVVG